MTTPELAYLTPLIENFTKKPLTTFTKLPKQVQLEQLKEIQVKLNSNLKALHSKGLTNECIPARQISASLRVINRYKQEELQQ